jgi:hypothetical protein
VVTVTAFSPLCGERERPSWRTARCQICDRPIPNPDWAGVTKRADGTGAGYLCPACTSVRDAAASRGD